MKHDTQTSNLVDSEEFKKAIESIVTSFGFAVHDQDPPRIISCSCFFLIINGVWVMCTAAHILDDIEKLSAKGISLSKWHINDVFSKNENSFAYPFDITKRNQLRIRNDDLGLDYCLIQVEELAIKNMSQSGVRAINREMIGDAKTADKWVVTGFPSQFLQKDGTRIKQKHFFVEATPTARPTNLEKDKNVHSLFGKLALSKVPNSEVIDLDGMSGGPIFGLYKNEDGKFGVKLVTMQSGWFPESHIITACPISPFLDAIDQLIKDEQDGISVIA